MGEKVEERREVEAEVREGRADRAEEKSENEGRIDRNDMAVVPLKLYTIS